MVRGKKETCSVFFFVCKKSQGTQVTGNPVKICILYNTHNNILGTQSHFERQVDFASLIMPPELKKLCR